MLLSALEQFSSDQAVTSSSAATNSTNVMDLGPLYAGNTVRDIGAGEELHLSILVTQSVTSAGAATVSPALVSSAAAALTSPTTHWAPPAAIAKATLVAGYWIAQGIIIPPGAYLRYLGLIFTVGTADLTAGKFSAWLHKGRFDTRVYASSFSNSV